MENPGKAFGNFRTCGAIQNTVQQESSPAKNSRTPRMNLDQRHQVQLEIDNMLEKGAIYQTSHLKVEFFSNVFLVGKKGGETVL